MKGAEEPKNWKQYYNNSRKNLAVDFEDVVETNGAEKESELFAQVQTPDDLLEAVKLVGEIEEDSRKYSPQLLEDLFNSAKADGFDLDKLPNPLGFRDAIKRVLVAEKEQKVREDYKNNVNNLFAKFEKLTTADSFAEIFKLLKTDANQDEKTKKANLIKDYNELALCCGLAGKDDPDNGGKILEKVQELSARAMEMLDAFKAEAEAYIKKDELEHDKKEIERHLLQAKKRDTLKDDLVVAEDIKKDLKAKREEREKQAQDKRKIFETKKTELAEGKQQKTKKEIDSELAVRHAEIVKKIAEVEVARKAYLEKDYEKTANLIRIKNFFKDGFGEKKDAAKEYQESSEISKTDREILAAKKEYDDKLKELQILVLDDAKKQNLPDEKLAELYAQFKVEQRVTLADERNKVKVEKLHENKFGWIKKAANEMTDWYQNLNWKYKLAIAGGLMATGAGVAGFTLAGVTFAGAGAGAVEAFTVVVAARRALGGVIAGVGAKRGLEVRGQARDQKEIKREQQKILEELKKIEEQDKKYQELGAKFDNLLGKDGPDVLKKIKNQDLRQNLTAAATGIFLGSGVAGELAKMGFHSVGDYFGWHGGVGHSGHQGPQPAHLEKDAASGAKNTNIKAPGVNATAEKIAVPKVEKWTIEKGSSIEGTLRDHIGKAHSEIKNLGKLDHDLWKNYMTEHETEIVEKVGQTEYAKMLKDGMVNVKPGTIISLDDSDPDPSNWKILGIGNEGVDNDFSHLNVHEHAPSHVATVAHPADVAEVPGSGTGHDLTDAAAAADATPSPNGASSAYNIGDAKGHLLNDNPLGDPSHYGHIADRVNDSGVDPSGLVAAESAVDNASTAGEVAVSGFSHTTINYIFENTRVRHFLNAGDHRRAIGDFRREIIKGRNPEMFDKIRKVDVRELMKNKHEFFSRKGGKMLGMLLKSPEFNSEKIINLEEITKNAVENLDEIKMAA